MTPEEKITIASDIAYLWSNGDEQTTVTTDQGELSSLAKFQKDLGETINVTLEQELIDLINPAVIQEVDTELTNRIGEVNDRIDEAFTLTNRNYEDLRINFAEAQAQREQADVDILLTHAKLFASEQELIRRLKNDEKLIDAVVTVDPDTGQIVNRAFQYADGRFSEAQVLIDGVQARVNLAVEEIALNDNKISDLSSEIDLLPGVIDQRATAIVTDAISALEPAVAFNFFDSTQGWLAVNGGITAGNNKITVTWGDIESPALSYVAEENPRLTIALTRLDANTTWDGSVIFTFDDASELVLNNALDPVTEQDVPTSRSIDLSGNDNYTGTVVGIRIILGTSVNDQFDIRSITVGKPQAIVQQIDDLEASITEAFSQINANEGKIEDRVTFTYYNDNTVTLSNASTVVNGLDSIVELQATRTEINENDIITKANNAAVFIDGSEATITQITNNIQSDIADVQQDADDAYASATTALSEVDAANGRIRNAITSIGGVSVSAEENSIQNVLLAYEQFKFDIGQAEVGVSVARAFDEISANADEFGAFAEQQRAVNAATQTEIGRVESEVLDTISARTGYCSIDGSPSGYGTPAECEANGGVWVDDAPLAETIRAARITTADGQEATVGQLGSTYVTEDGELVAKGSMTTDVNGYVSGFINRNDGTTSDFDILTSRFRVGDTDSQGNFIPSLYLDTEVGQLTFKGNVILGDGYSVTGEEDIRALDGGYTEFRYRRSATQPTVDANNLAPPGWFLSPPSGSDLLWIIEAQKTADGEFQEGASWSTPTQFSGDNGSAGQSTFKSIVFKRTNTTPTTPTGGNYLNPVPADWSDGVPEGEETLWQSTRVFTDDGESPQQSGWTTPRELTNTTDFEVQYSSVKDPNTVGDPESNPTNWSTTPATDTIFQAQRKKENGVWDSWQVFRVKGEKGDQGIDSRSVKLLASKQAIKYNTAGGSPDPSSITFNAEVENFSGNVTYQFLVDDVEVQARGTTSTYTYTSPTSYSSAPVQVEVVAYEDEVVKATDQITLYSVQDGSDAVTVVLSNESHTVPSDSDGSNPVLTGSGTSIKVFEGANDLNFRGEGDSGDPIGVGEFRFNTTVTGGLSAPVISGIDTTTGVVAEYTTMTADTASNTFDITVKRTDGRIETFSKVQTLSKSKKGEKGDSGVDGYNQATLYAYQRSPSAPSQPTSSTTYTFSTGQWTAPDAWSTTIPPNNGNPLWVIVASASNRSDTDVISASEWTPAEILSENGTDGVDGYNTATVYAYKRTGYSGSSGTIQNNTVYTFSDGSLSGLDTDWSLSAPDNSEGAVLWVSQATAFSRENTDTITADEWSAPVVLSVDGVDGDNGSDGTSVLVVYAINSAGDDQSLTQGGREYVQYVEYVGTAPSLPVGGTFVKFVGSDGQDGSDGQSIWPIYATDSSGNNQSFSSSDRSWVTFYESTSQPELPVLNQTFVKYVGEDGQDGQDGNDGATGAGFYGSTFTDISTDQATITSRFVSTVGRNPVHGDVFVQSNTSNTSSLALEYRNGVWGDVALRVNGSMVVDGSVSASKLNIADITSNDAKTRTTIDPLSSTPISVIDNTTNKAIFSIQQVDGESKALVNGTGGKGFIKTTDAITPDVKKSINPYYEGIGATDTKNGLVVADNDSIHFNDFPTGENGRVSVVFSLSASSSYTSLFNQNWQAPKWRIRVYTGAVFGTLHFDKTYEGVAYNQAPDYGDRIEPDLDIQWYGYYSIEIEDGLNIDLPTGTTEDIYIRVDRISGEATSLSGEAEANTPSFKRNSFVNNDTGYWVDKDTGFTYQWGQFYVNANSTTTEDFLIPFDNIFQCIVSGRVSPANYVENVGLSSFNNTSVTGRNWTPSGELVHYIAVGVTSGQ